MLTMLLVVLLAVSANLLASVCSQGEQFWFDSARKELERRVGATPPADRARNVVLVVGDGLGLPTLTAARLLRGQKDGRLGEDTWLAWDRFPAVSLAKTYNDDAQVGDSAACATALLCGVKANHGTLGLSAARFNDCDPSAGHPVSSLLSWAQDEGLATGLVTNTRLTHATPAALYAHAHSRYWEDDSKVPVQWRTVCKDIARQLVEDSPGRDINVILGGGARHWSSDARRLDGRDLAGDWLRDKRRRGVLAHRVHTASELARVNTAHLDYLLGIFSESHMSYEVDRTSLEPSLSEMTAVALTILQKSERGFFLFLEGGRIDHASHHNNVFRALEETLQLEAAVEQVLAVVNTSDTLVVFTSDHSSVLSLGGLAAPRGNSVFGADSVVSDVDGLPYATVQFGNGPAYPGARRDSAPAAAVPRSWATHGGEDVPVFAQGPLASVLFTGVFDQSYVPHAVAYAACLGEHRQRCSVAKPNYPAPDCQATQHNLVKRSVPRDGAAAKATSLTRASAVLLAAWSLWTNG